MATWNDVHNFIKSNYKVSVDEPGHLGLLFSTDQLRSQTVHVWRQSLRDGSEEWIQLESPFGTLGSGDLEAAVRAVGGMVCGGIATAGDILVLRHSVPLGNVDINEIERPLVLVTSSADELEKQFSGRDDF